MIPHKCPVCDGNGERKKPKRPCHACKQTGIVWEGAPAPVYVPVHVYPYHPVSPYWYSGTFCTNTYPETATLSSTPGWTGVTIGTYSESNMDSAISGTTTDVSCGIYTSS
jgi:hypothetical protein